MDLIAGKLHQHGSMSFRCTGKSPLHRNRVSRLPIAVALLTAMILLASCSTVSTSDPATPVSTSSTSPATSATSASPATQRSHGVLKTATPIDAPTGLKAWRVTFSSELRDGAPTDVTGLVYVPDRTAPPGGWPVVSVGHPTVGLADVCAPSQNIGLLETTVAGLFGGRGFAVVQSDYPGLGTDGPHPFLDGISSGNSMLDIVSAAATIDGVTLSSRTVVWGHSQGGHAALFAGSQAAKYSPDLQVVGVVAGAPPSQLSSLADELSTSPQRGYVTLIASGLTASHPDLKLEDILTAEGRTFTKRLDTECSDAVVTSAATATLLKPTGLTQPWIDTLNADEPGNLKIAAPVFIIHGAADELVPASSSEALAQQLLAGGATVERKVYPGATHAGAALASLTDVSSWIAQKLQAGSQTTTTVATGTPAWTGATGKLRAVLERGERQTLVIAHAGGEQEAPHSTMYAFKRAQKMGVDVFELDVHLSSDGQLVVFHDSTVDRTTNETGPVATRTAAELAKLDAAHWFAPGCWDCRTTATEFPLRGVRTGAMPPPDGFTAEDFGVTTLDALLKEFPDSVFDIEIKTDGPDGGTKVAEALAKRLMQDPSPDRFLVVSFDDAALKTFRAGATIATSPGLTELTQFVLAGVPLSPTPVLQVPPNAQGLSILTPAFLAKAKAAGIAIWIWPADSTTDTADDYRTLLKDRPNGIIAGRPQALIDILRK
jgi:glycerophosphoryl diester phosphodiesterase